MAGDRSSWDTPAWSASGWDDETVAAPGFGNDPTAPVTRPDLPTTRDPNRWPPPSGGGGGRGGGPGRGGGQGRGRGGYDDDDRRRLWFVGGGVLVLGLMIGGLVAAASGGGGNEETTTSSSASTSSSTSSTSTSTSTSTTTSTTTAASPQILQYTASPTPVSCPADSSTVSVHLTWATANATNVSLSIDGPAIYGNYAQTGTQNVPFVCPASQHIYLLTANGTNGQKVQRQIIVQGIAPPTTTSSSGA